jgi:hypothetical protein
MHLQAVLPTRRGGRHKVEIKTFDSRSGGSAADEKQSAGCYVTGSRVSISPVGTIEGKCTEQRNIIEQTSANTRNYVTYCIPQHFIYGIQS